MCNSSWKNPNDLILVLRCTTLEFAKDLVNLGQIKFSTPKSWEQYGKQGRGDIYEGTLIDFIFVCIEQHPYIVKIPHSGV